MISFRFMIQLLLLLMFVVVVYDPLFPTGMSCQERIRSGIIKQEKQRKKVASIDEGDIEGQGPLYKRETKDYCVIVSFFYDSCKTPFRLYLMFP